MKLPWKKRPEDLAAAEELMEIGNSHLESRSYSDAIKVARQLIRMRYSGGHELLGLAYARSGKTDEAIRALERGTEQAPRAWVLWKLLGDCYSDASRFSEAENAYQAALKQEPTELDIVHFNRGIAFQRANAWNQAEEALSLVVGPQLRRYALALRIENAIELGQTARAIQRAAELSQMRPNHAEPDDSRIEARISAACAAGFALDPRLRRRAMCFAIQAIRHKAIPRALSVLRELQRNPVTNAHGYRMTLEGIWPEPFENEKIPPGFFRNLEVVAATESDAFRYARRIFPPKVRKSLRVESITEVESSAVLEGVHSASGYFFFPRKKAR